jgi:prolyl-tRNA synthetase
MKDMYSFHTSDADFQRYYDECKIAYLKLFKRCGLEAKIVEADGGMFTTKRTHEFQVFCETGEDTIRYCDKCDFAQNIEICEVKTGDKCPNCDGVIKENKGIEVGNIFPLETKYSGAMGADFTDESGKKQPMIMGCYGIGVSRILGTVVEVHHDAKGIIWPEEIAPFRVHLVPLGKDKKVMLAAEKLYAELLAAGVEVLFDDREMSAGMKLNDADLIGLPLRIIVSEKTLANNQAEFKRRDESEAIFIGLDEVIERVR